MTTTTTKIERSGPDIRAVLADCSPAECQQFEAEFRQAAARVGQTFDLAAFDAVLDRWRGIAAIRANPLTDHEQELVAGARVGDESGWVETGVAGAHRTRGHAFPHVG